MTKKYLLTILLILSPTILLAHNPFGAYVSIAISTVFFTGLSLTISWIILKYVNRRISIKRKFLKIIFVLLCGILLFIIFWVTLLPIVWELLHILAKSGH